MRVIDEANYRMCHRRVLEAMAAAPLVRTETWQSVSTAGKPEMATYEVEDVILTFHTGTEDLGYHRLQVGPNLPWADAHFEEDRVSGEPLNPGNTWQDWPWGNKAASFREIIRYGDPQFNHTYAERYWPKYAGRSHQGKLAYVGSDHDDILPREGVRYRYGDLNDLVELLVKQPNTRAAYLPVWFPEDTGIVHGGRTPCSIGYLFRLRGGELSIFYQIRSCDVLRHMNDDVYLTIRLLLWVLERLRERDASWSSVKPGRFTMAIGSLHMFVNDRARVLG